jgi:DNA repair exonuclease SbcCD ATPase subunit
MQLRRQIEEQKGKMQKDHSQLSVLQQEQSKLEKQLEDYTKQIGSMTKQHRRVEDKSKKVASDNQTLKSRVAELEEQLDWKEKQIGEKNSKIQQLSKQLDVEAASVAKKQQNGGGQHDSGQQDSAVVVALNDRVAELEKEVERVKSSTLTRNTSKQEVKGGGLKYSASDTMIVAGGGPSHMVSGQSPTSDIPEFYRSDLLRVLEEKTDYMTRFYDAEEENDLLRQQLDSALNHQRKPRVVQSSGVRNIMEKTVTLRRDGQ